VDCVTVMASMAFTRREKRCGLFRAFCLDAPFLCPGYDHRGMEGLGLWFTSCRGHGVLQRIICQADFSESISGEQIGNRRESSGTRIDQDR
jgi:hypothetical protein